MTAHSNISEIVAQLEQMSEHMWSRSVRVADEELKALCCKVSSIVINASYEIKAEARLQSEDANQPHIHGSEQPHIHGSEQHCDLHAACTLCASEANDTFSNLEANCETSDVSPDLKAKMATTEHLLVHDAPGTISYNDYFYNRDLEIHEDWMYDHYEESPNTADAKWHALSDANKKKLLDDCILMDNFVACDGTCRDYCVFGEVM